MRQVLATAAALVGPADLLVLDEPTVGLDPGHRRRVNDLLAGHVARGGTVLLSSHQLDDAERLCTRVGLMAAGRLLAEGPRPSWARPPAAAGIYPSDLRRSPTLELAYAEVTSGLAPDPPRPPVQLVQ
jgi:energy-coupling factor transporter ATP-binding protein EcfA2